MKKGLLIILDGYGEAKDSEFNAVTRADTPFLHFIKEKAPNTLIRTDGGFVGLPDGFMGGSEVGHQTIGAGKIIKSETVRVDDDINSNAFYENKSLNLIFNKVSKANGTLHIIGLLSDKKIHSDFRHIRAILKLAKEKNIKNVLIHCIMDGRDSGVNDGINYLNQLKSFIKEFSLGKVASMGGRFFAMDREGNFDRTDIYVNAIRGQNFTDVTPEKYLKSQYKLGVSDEFIQPVSFVDKKELNFDKSDAVFLFNTRADRMRQLCTRLENFDCKIISMSNYGDFKKITPLYVKSLIKNTLTEFLTKKGYKVLKISESTKYAHVTYFFNGGREEPFDGEYRIHIPTKKVKNYDEFPKMRACEITKEAIKAVKNNKYDLIVINYSNPDMLGHTANFAAVKKGLEVIDNNLKKLCNKAFKKGYFILVCADHGNAEVLKNEDGSKNTSHTLSSVKLVILDKDLSIRMKKSGGLQDVAPTILKLMGVEDNPDFEGKPLFVSENL